MKDVSGTNGEIHDLAGAHEDAFQRRLVAFGFNVLDRGDDERSGDLIELAASEGLDDVALQSPLLVMIRDDSPTFEVAP